MYTKDLASLLQLLKVSGQSSVLRVEPATDGTGAWYARIALVEGEVTSCQVQRGENGEILLSGPPALQWLTSLGGLFWKLEEAGTSSLPFSPSAPPVAHDMQRREPEMLRSSDALYRSSQPGPARRLTGTPRRTARGKREAVNSSWSRDHRLVFALVDGRRTLEEIASLLHKPPGIVMNVLYDFQDQGLIERE